MALQILTASSTATRTQARCHATVPAATNNTIATIAASATTRISTLNIGPAHTEGVDGLCDRLTPYIGGEAANHADSRGREPGAGELYRGPPSGLDWGDSTGRERRTFRGG